LEWERVGGTSAFCCRDPKKSAATSFKLYALGCSRRFSIPAKKHTQRHASLRGISLIKLGEQLAAALNEA